MHQEISSVKGERTLWQYPSRTGKRELCSLIYYPEQKLELVKQNEPDINDWYHITCTSWWLYAVMFPANIPEARCANRCHAISRILSRELLHEHTEDHDKTAYVNVIVDTIISTGRADDFIIAIANVIQRLAIDQLHILGDIYDRGPGAHIILDKMRRYHSWDIQWGNHDVLWMGAAAGNDACICNVIRLSCDTPTSRHWKKAMASTSYHSLLLRWKPTRRMIAKNFCLSSAEVQQQWMKRPSGSPLRCTRL